MIENTGKTILIVDDEPDIITYLSTLLEDNGFRVITAANGKAGEEEARRARPALILLDISMPEESGVRMFRNLQEDSSTSAIPVIIITGVSHDFKRFIETRRQVHPPAGYFDKPPNPEQLLAKINEILEPKSIA
jgi:DNA-binding response OmpR family regulator